MFITFDAETCETMIATFIGGSEYCKLFRTGCYGSCNVVLLYQIFRRQRKSRSSVESPSFSLGAWTVPAMTSISRDLQSSLHLSQGYVYMGGLLKYTCCMIDRNECLPDMSAAETSNKLYSCYSEAFSGNDLDRLGFWDYISLVVVSTDGV